MQEMQVVLEAQVHFQQEALEPLVLQVEVAQAEALEAEAAVVQDYFLLEAPVALVKMAQLQQAINLALVDKVELAELVA